MGRSKRGGERGGGGERKNSSVVDELAVLQTYVNKFVLLYA